MRTAASDGRVGRITGLVVVTKVLEPSLAPGLAGFVCGGVDGVAAVGGIAGVVFEAGEAEAAEEVAHF